MFELVEKGPSNLTLSLQMKMRKGFVTFWYGIVVEQAIDKNHCKVRILLATHKDLADKPAELLANYVN